MQLSISTGNLTPTGAILDHIRRRLAFALGRHDAHVSDVAVRLGDVNGPKGGVDKCCRVDVRLRGAGHVLVDERSEDLYEAIDRATTRAKRAVTRRLERQRGG